MPTEFPIKAKIKYEASMYETYKNRTIDDRNKINSTEEFPFRCIGPVVSKQKDGNFYLGTATLIAPNYIITAAHNPYEESFRAPEFYFAPGINGNVTNLEYSKGTEFFIFDSYAESEESPDIAIMKLEKPLGDLYGYFDLGILENKTEQEKKLNFFGYPGDKYNAANFSYELWGQKINKYNFDGQNINFQCDSFSGMSGSALFDYDKEKEKGTVYGVFHSHLYLNNNEKTGFACLLNEDIIKEIRNYISEN